VGGGWYKNAGFAEKVTSDIPAMISPRAYMRALVTITHGVDYISYLTFGRGMYVPPGDVTTLVIGPWERETYLQPVLASNMCPYCNVGDLAFTGVLPGR